MDTNYSNTLPSHSFWQFSIDLYRNRDVENACLSLQNRHGLNVNLILFCCWAASESYGRLEKNDFHKAFAAINRWHEMVTLELRKLRRMVKKMNMYHTSYQKALEDEIAAEHIEQLMLADTLLKHPHERRTSGQKVADAFSNVLLYLRLLQVDADDEDYAALYTLLTPIFPDIERSRMIKLCVPLIKPSGRFQNTMQLDGSLL